MYCNHIEDKLPKSNQASVQAYPTDRIDDYWIKTEFSKKQLTLEQVEARLKGFGLGDFEIELLMLKYIDLKKMAEIVKIQGWVNINSASHYLRQTLKKLREGRFKFR